jgi:hypothetical protein
MLIIRGVWYRRIGQGLIASLTSCFEISPKMRPNLAATVTGLLFPGVVKGYLPTGQDNPVKLALGFPVLYAGVIRLSRGWGLYAACFKPSLAHVFSLSLAYLVGV